MNFDKKPNARLDLAKIQNDIAKKILYAIMTHAQKKI